MFHSSFSILIIYRNVNNSWNICTIEKLSTRDMSYSQPMVVHYKHDLSSVESI